jgi:pyrrolidone-carboxylate peptidase
MITAKIFLRRSVVTALIFGCCHSWSAGADSNVDPAIRKFVQTYFGSWSKADFSTYRSSFRSFALITLLDGDQWRPWDLAQFLDDQEHMQSQRRMTEVPLAIDVKALSNKSAFVEVSWRLERAPGTVVTGKDWFVLVKDTDDWKIDSLTFWEDGAPNPVGGADSQTNNLTASRPKIVVSGFEQFGGRSVNASSELAQAIVKSFPQWDLKFVQVPVVWGAPREAIAQAHLVQPTIWIAFGEGRKEANGFEVETVARNARGPGLDNKNQTPSQKEIDPKGTQQLKVDFSAETLSKRLRDLGYHCKASADAGESLCEEMLYSLLDEKNSADSKLKQAIFIHVPIEGTKIRIRGAEVPFTGDNIQTAAHDVFETIVAVLKISPAK